MPIPESEIASLARDWVMENKTKIINRITSFLDSPTRLRKWPIINIFIMPRFPDYTFKIVNFSHEYSLFYSEGIEFTKVVVQLMEDELPVFNFDSRRQGNCIYLTAERPEF